MHAPDPDGVCRFSVLFERRAVVHGFTTRSLGDGRDSAVLDRICRDMHLPRDRVVTAAQVHGDHVVTVDRKQGGTCIADADGLVTREHDLILCIRTADCVPVMFHEPSCGIIGLVHAGWRGISRGIIDRTLEVIGSLGGDVTGSRIGLGPAIGPCCYEIGDDTASVLAAYDPAFVVRRNGKCYGDLHSGILSRLLASKISGQQIAAMDLCTACSPDLCFSHRREGRAAGRSASFIGLIPSV
jgi:hypothetical protein